MPLEALAQPACPSSCSSEPSPPSLSASSGLPPPHEDTQLQAHTLLWPPQAIIATACLGASSNACFKIASRLPCTMHETQMSCIMRANMGNQACLQSSEQSRVLCRQGSQQSVHCPACPGRPARCARTCGGRLGSAEGSTPACSAASSAAFATVRS